MWFPVQVKYAADFKSAVQGSYIGKPEIGCADSFSPWNSKSKILLVFAERIFSDIFHIATIQRFRLEVKVLKPNLRLKSFLNEDRDVGRVLKTLKELQKPKNTSSLVAKLTQNSGMDTTFWFLGAAGKFCKTEGLRK